jgi:hypothetical protein
MKQCKSRRGKEEKGKTRRRGNEKRNALAGFKLKCALLGEMRTNLKHLKTLFSFFISRNLKNW